MGHGRAVPEAYYDKQNHNYDNMSSEELIRIRSLPEYKAEDINDSFIYGSNHKLLHPMFYCPICGVPLSFCANKQYAYFRLRNINCVHMNTCKYRYLNTNYAKSALYEEIKEIWNGLR